MSKTSPLIFTSLITTLGMLPMTSVWANPNAVSPPIEQSQTVLAQANATSTDSVDDFNPPNDADTVPSDANMEDQLSLDDEELANSPDDANVEDIPIDQIRQFVETFQLVKKNYVDNVSNDQLFEQASHGLLEGLDPYSRYLTDEQYQQLMQFTEGQIAKIPFQLSYVPEQHQWQIAGIANGSDAYELGLRNGEVVEKINNNAVQYLDQRTVDNLLTGSLGSVVKLKIKRGNRSVIADVVRDQALNYDVEPYLTDERILILKIKAFQQDTVPQVQRLLSTYQQRAPIRGVIIDIRDNPGGLLSSAVELADLFLEKGLIVSTKGRIEAAQQFQALASQDPITYPVAILQNRFSASASEVFSAALKENQRATVFGETSYGKGAVQKLFPLQQGAVQLTVSHYFTPNGEMIEGKGIEADRKLNMSDQQTDRQIQEQASNQFGRMIP
ncbi:carboxyl-terminal processing protease [Acinetobacter marinus]|uniref:Carboxyl-terminal processing protease n=1 Tax=Acinetobacter marinus TaxID=281375 RepID=A0A1G6HDT3_9GAMM|nr:S41 family peptidase [Acinetobacter marinus]SDB92313.1 carboxyl-terminal processing protease [Acinetobacter marinus]